MKIEFITTLPGDKNFNLFGELPLLLYSPDDLRIKQPEELNADYLHKCIIILADGNLCGRLAIYTNPGLSYRGAKAISIGNYECADDLFISGKLIDFAFREAKILNAEYIIGPMNGSTWNNYRFSLHHNYPNFFLEPYHHLYYNEQFRHAGFLKIAGYYSAVTTNFENLLPVAGHLTGQINSNEIQLRPIDLENYEADLWKLYAFITIAFRDNFLYTPLSWKSFREKYLKARSFIDPDFFIIAEHQKKITGFCFSVKDYYNPNMNNLIIKTLARHPDKAWAGLGYIMAARIIKAASEKGYQSIIHAFMIENSVSGNLSNILSAKPYKQYALYGKNIQTGEKMQHELSEN